MARKITDDDIRAQIEKNKVEHNCLRNAVGHLGGELGLQLDDKGDVVGRTKMEQSVAPSVSFSPPVQTFDKEVLKQVVTEAIKENPQKVTIEHPQTNTQQLSYQSVNKNIADGVVTRLSPTLNDFCNQIMEACGSMLDAVNEKPIFEERTILRLRKIHSFVGRCWRWLRHDFASSLGKIFAYEFAIVGVFIGGWQYHENQQLEEQHKKDAVIRYVLSGNPANEAMIERFDSLMSKDGVDDIYTTIAPESNM